MQTELKKFDKFVFSPSSGTVLIDLSEEEEEEEQDEVKMIGEVKTCSEPSKICKKRRKRKKEKSSVLCTKRRKENADQKAGILKMKNPKRAEVSLIDLTDEQEELLKEKPMQPIIDLDDMDIILLEALVADPVCIDLCDGNKDSEMEEPVAGPSGIQNIPENPIVPNSVQDEDVNISRALLVTDTEDLCKLFIGGLDADTTDASLKDYFKKWGDVLDAVIKRDEATGRSRGFGFITFTRTFMVDEVQKNRPHKIDDRLVCCRRKLPTKELSYPGGFIRKLFVPNLNDEVKERDLNDYFKQFGKILGCSVVKNFAFVTFEDYDSADKVLLLRVHKIKGQYIEPKPCLNREQLAERNIKFYLKYFGGFQNWPMHAIEAWIRRHPEICHNNRQPPYMENRNCYSPAQSELFMFGGVWMDRNVNMPTPRAPSRYRFERSPQRLPSITQTPSEREVPRTPSQETEVKREMTDSDVEDYETLFDVKKERQDYMEDASWFDHVKDE